MKYAVVNTSYDLPSQTFGVVESRHKTIETALKGMNKIRDRERNIRNPNEYSVLRIVRLHRIRKVGDTIPCDWNRLADGSFENLKDTPFKFVASLVPVDLLGGN